MGDKKMGGKAALAMLLGFTGQSIEELMDVHKKVEDFPMSAVSEVPQLKRRRVWCTRCGRTQKVNSGVCMAHGWPECCGETMTIDSPEEREALRRDREENAQ